MLTMTDDIRAAVRARLGELNWNRSKLARLTDLHKQTISDLLNGKNEGKIDTWEKIFKALGLKLVVVKDEGS
jgi:DNA-binding phage protein